MTPKLMERAHQNIHASAARTWVEVARSAYRAYAATTSWKIRGEQMPPFDDLPPAIKKAWEAAVRQAVDVVADHPAAPYGSEAAWDGWRTPQERTEAPS